MVRLWIPAIATLLAGLSPLGGRAAGTAAPVGTTGAMVPQTTAVIPQTTPVVPQAAAVISQQSVVMPPSLRGPPPALAGPPPSLSGSVLTPSRMTPATISPMVQPGVPFAVSGPAQVTQLLLAHGFSSVGSIRAHPNGSFSALAITIDGRQIPVIIDRFGNVTPES